MVINEYQVNLGDESGRELVRKQMKAFLKLGEEVDSSKVAENYRPPTSWQFLRKIVTASSKFSLGLSLGSLTSLIQKC